MQLNSQPRPQVKDTYPISYLRTPKIPLTPQVAQAAMHKYSKGDGLNLAGNITQNTECTLNTKCRKRPFHAKRPLQRPFLIHNPRGTGSLAPVTSSKDTCSSFCIRSNTLTAIASSFTPEHQFYDHTFSSIQGHTSAKHTDSR